MYKTWLKFIGLLLIVPNLIFAQISEQALLQDIQKYRDQNNPAQAAASLNKLGMFYWESEKHQKAIEAFEQSITINKELGNENAMKALYSNVGMINSDIGQLETSVVYFRKSLLLSKKQKNKQDIATNLINISVALNTMNRSKEALENLNEATSYAAELTNKSLLRTCYGLLAEIHEKLGNSQESMKYFSMYASFEKEIQKEQLEKEKQKTRAKVAEMKQVTEKAIKEKEQTQERLFVTQDSLKVVEELNRLRQLEIDKKNAEIKNQRLMIIISVIGLAFTLITALFIFRSYHLKKKHNKELASRNEEIRKQNEQIQSKNLKINQSINYAFNIQGALLPQDETVRSVFSDSFVFFKPRDVVSGDFYWINKLVKDHTTYRIAAAVDCTGHGVPGAFMSMLGMSFLNDIILDKQIIDPAEILETLHLMVKSELKQEKSGNMDGMDMAICVYDELRKTMKFAGAVNPLVYVQNGELKVEKANLFGIGGQMKESMKSGSTHFETKTIDCSVPTTCYVFSDGFADQFGGEKGRKYLAKKFRKFLHQMYDKPMSEQHQLLDDELSQWLGDTYQRVDDVLVIGFRV